jgi:ferritin-like metal-binding protein YciE
MPIHDERNRRMFEHFETPDELFRYRLGSALQMEHDSLSMLGDLEEAAPSGELKQMFTHHADETREQIRNLELAFEKLGYQVDDSPSPTTKGMAKEAHSLLGKADPRLRDDVAISAALGTEHYEISVYQSLIASAQAMGAAEVVELLQHNLEQEEHTSEELVSAGNRFAQAGVA